MKTMCSLGNLGPKHGSWGNLGGFSLQKIPWEKGTFPKEKMIK